MIPIPEFVVDASNPDGPIMNVFNPRILDASLRDVTSTLTDEQKADVLIYAMQHLSIERFVASVESGPDRASSQSRRDLMFAFIDLEAILVLDPEHAEARSLMTHATALPGKAEVTRRGLPGFSTEIWRQIAQYLPRRDVKTLLLVPHVLSRIASQIVFRKVDLHFGTDKWDSQRSADILTRVITDAGFASIIRTLRIFVPGREVVPMSFQTGMLANALPKMKNLKNVHCSMRWKDIYNFLKVLETAHRRLSGLSLHPSDGTGELRIPKFKHITQFAYCSTGDSPAEVNDFLSRNQGSIRTIHIQNLNWTFPSSVISIRNLTHLDFLGTFAADSRALTDILTDGHQLESLRLKCVLECSASIAFRDNLNALPFLKDFSLSLMGYRVNDSDLFPAISEFLRGRVDLHMLQLTVPSAEYAHKRLGYDANVWGVLPSLVNLRSLSATLPKDVAAAVAMWLVPRSVQSLTLHSLPSGDLISFVQQLRPGLPPSLKFIGFAQTRIADLPKVIEQGFPTVRLARVEDDYFTVTKDMNGAIGTEEWPKGRTRYNSKDWLECYDCEDCEWRNPSDFSYA
ncbi:hypothetical protein EIP91_009552 [Steccherinum ochraceum]|uniref:Uncharacterized protein n=1 Tax=Steccherinum ochraceum TaxID=92696 RepID=A0A4R0R9K2_9APHY|nr:hypothetical protein EIP91_009552 [Steccherinum ochraceum]